MATLNEIAYNIKNLAYNGDTNEEENIGIRQIKFWIHYHRAKILKELEREGKGIPEECLQHYKFNSDNLLFYITGTSQATALKTYIDGLPGSSESRLVAISPRLLILAGAGGDLMPNNYYYGNDFYSEDRGGQQDEIGYMPLVLPEILNISGYGVKNLVVRRNNVNGAIPVHNVYEIDVPIISKTSNRRKRYDRFGKKSITANIENYYTGASNANSTISNPLSNATSSQKQLIFIRNLQSMLRQSSRQDDIGSPIFYRVSAHLLLANPTEDKNWINDNDVYPFPDYLVNDLTRAVMQEMQIALNTQPDMVADGYDTTRAQVQQRAQR